MLTLTKTTTTKRSLETPEAIAAHLGTEYRRRRKAAPFKPGDGVRIIRRDGIPDAFMVGDVGVVMLCDPEFHALTTLLGKNDQGATIQFPVPTHNLERLA